MRPSPSAPPSAQRQLVRAFSLWTFAVVVLVLVAVAIVAEPTSGAGSLVALARHAARDRRSSRGRGTPTSLPLHEPDLRPAAGAGPALEAPAGLVLRRSRLRELFSSPYEHAPRQPLRARAVRRRVGGLLRRLRLEQRRPPAEPSAKRRTLVVQMCARDRADPPARRRLARAPLAVARSRSACARLPSGCSSALLPLAGIVGMLYFTVSYPTPDGDVIKATYMLTTVPAWALCFGYGLDGVLDAPAAAPAGALRPARARRALGPPLGALRLASRDPLRPPPLPSPSVTAVLFTCAGQRVDIVTAFGRAGATTVAVRSRSARAGAVSRRSHGARAAGRRSRLRPGARGARRRARRPARRAR